LNEDEHSVKVFINSYGGCSGGISLRIIATIPKKLLEST
jgi:hypothetical protein